MRYVQSIFCLFFISLPGTLFAQEKNDSVNLKGMQISAVIKKAVIEKAGGDDFTRLAIDLEIEVSNDTDKAQIIIGRAVQVVGIRITESRDEIDKRKYVLDRQHVPSFKDNSIVKDLTAQSRDVQVVYPTETFRQKISYWVALPEPLPPALLKKVWLQLDVSFFPMNTMSAEGNELQRAWIDTGQLFLETMTMPPVEAYLTLKSTAATTR